MIKKVILIALIIFAASFRLSAENTAEVSLRYSRNGGLVRIVIEANDATISNAGVSASPAAIRIDFPTQFSISKPNDFPYVTIKKDRSLILNLKDVVEIKPSRLTAPSRLVFDLKTLEGQQKWLPQQQAQVPQQKGPWVNVGPVVSPGPQREAAPQTGLKQPFQPINQAAGRAAAIRVVVLDPGHGGYDYGIISEDAREKDVNLSMSKDLSTAMAKKGITVFLDRRVDQSISLGERIGFAISKKPDLFISVHAASWNGFAVYVATSEDLNSDPAVRLYSVSSRQSRYLAQSKELARSIALNLKREFHAEVALRELPLPVLTSLDAQAVMIDYPSPKFFVSDKMRAKFVSAVLQGISSYEE
jgi:N-acetylmuramoyl-L-alanine amidase